MRRLNFLDRDRELQKPAPLGSVRSETPAERFARLLRQSVELPEDSAAARRWRSYWSGQARRSKF